MAAFPPAPTGSRKGFLSCLLCENTMELQEVKLTKVLGVLMTGSLWNVSLARTEPPVTHQLQFTFP